MLAIHKSKIKLFKNFNILTITNVVIKDNLIYCSYNVSFATRIHHLPIVDHYKLPEIIINSFAFKYFSPQEQEFLNGCMACNNTLKLSGSSNKYEKVKLSTGKEIIIIIYNNESKETVLQFKINDLSKFTGLCRRYKNPTEVEKLITQIFNTRQ